MLTLYMLNMLIEKSPKIAKKFYCEKCNYTCNKKSEYTRHELTTKHERLINVNRKSPNVAKTYKCECGKVYQQCAGLSRHKRTCKMNENSIITHQIENNDERIDSLVKELSAERVEKSEMKSMFMLIIEKFQDILQRNEQDRLQSNNDNKEILNKIVEIIPKLGEP